jgi:endonuclease-3
MPKESLTRKKERAREIIHRLAQDYPDAECALHHRSPFQLLIATILSAQCTDARVNEVTKSLFMRFPTPQSFAEADLEELEEAIRPTGFFRNKAKSIQACCASLLADHGGEVPATMEELTRLGGVGRKTANVILGNCFGVPGVVVDTHVGRLARRMALSREEDPVKVERDLEKLVPPEEQTMFCHRMIHHGRKICMARKPLCSICSLLEVCPQVGVG